MSLINNGYWHGFDIATTSGTASATSGWYSNNYTMYNNGMLNREQLLVGMDHSLPEAKPRKKSFEDKLQDEIDDWLSIFKES